MENGRKKRNKAIRKEKEKLIQKEKVRKQLIKENERKEIRK